MFSDESQMKRLLVKWLTSHGFRAEARVYVKNVEIDVVAYAPLRITKKGFEKVGTSYLYAFETKIATTPRLARDVVEQAVTRLLIADYVYIAVPRVAEVWVDSKTKKVVEPPNTVLKIANNVYSKNIGILALDPDGRIEVVGEAQRSSLTVEELKKMY